MRATRVCAQCEQAKHHGQQRRASLDRPRARAGDIHLRCRYAGLRQFNERATTSEEVEGTGGAGARHGVKVLTASAPRWLLAGRAVGLEAHVENVPVAVPVTVKELTIMRCTAASRCNAIRRKRGVRIFSGVVMKLNVTVWRVMTCQPRRATMCGRSRFALGPDRLAQVTGIPRERWAEPGHPGYRPRNNISPGQWTPVMRLRGGGEGAELQPMQ